MLQCRNVFRVEKLRRSFSVTAAPRASGKIGRSRSRVDIIKLKLCDDVIERLAPSLVQHRHCDLIDVNPGRCLWSAKLHQHLQPRRHILMEPDGKYKASLDRLLSKPQCRYRHVPWSGAVAENYDRLFAEGFLPEQRRRQADEADYDSLNPSLLLVANLGQATTKQGRSNLSDSTAVLYRLMMAIRHHSQVQAYGLVRMLVWFGSNRTPMMLPRTATDRRRWAVEAEFSFERIVEVAGAEGEWHEKWRERRLELQSSVDLLRRTREQGLSTAEARKGPMLRQAEAYLASPSAAEPVPEMVDERRSWHVELEELERKLGDGELTKFKAEAGSSGDGAPELHPDYVRLAKLRKDAIYQRKQRTRVTEMLREASRLEEMADRLQASSGLAADERARLEEEYAAARRAHAGKVEGLSDQARQLMMRTADDRMLFAARPPTLMWDRRPAEPLQVEAGEFSRGQKLALLDLQPRPFPARLGRSLQSMTTYDYIVSSLFSQAGRSLPQAVEALAPGAAEALLPQIPMLKDRRRGGSPNLEQMRVRRLTPEMIEALVEAWEAWPFRLDRFEVLKRLQPHSPEVR